MNAITNAYAARFWVLAERVARQSGRRRLVNATRLWNLADHSRDSRNLFQILAESIPAAFRDTGNPNSIRFAYWNDNEPAGFRIALPVVPARCGFNCPRTCPRFERVDVCRFSGILAAAGVVGVVNSETVSVDVAFSDTETLAAAVVAMGGQVIGQGLHELFETEPVAGFGFRLPDWSYPLVATAGGKLAFDNYGGKWGNPADIDKLRAEYSMMAAANAAAANGWQSERIDVNGAAALRVYHPGGGYLDVTGGLVDANGFDGIGCHAAAEQLAAAMGSVAAVAVKPERNRIQLTQNVME